MSEVLQFVSAVEYLSSTGLISKTYRSQFMLVCSR